VKPCRLGKLTNFPGSNAAPPKFHAEQSCEPSQQCNVERVHNQSLAEQIDTVGGLSVPHRRQSDQDAVVEPQITFCVGHLAL